MGRSCSQVTARSDEMKKRQVGGCDDDEFVKNIVRQTGQHESDRGDWSTIFLNRLIKSIERKAKHLTR